MTTLKKPVTRVTSTSLSSFWGADRGKRLVITLVPGKPSADGKDVPDVIEIRPERTRRVERIAVVDAYRLAMSYRKQCDQLARNREKLEKKKQRLATQRLNRAVRRELKDGAT